MKKQLRLVQILRAIAASMVVIHHFNTANEDYGKTTSLINKLGIGELGASGVDIFFVISGFIMFYTQFSKKSTTEGSWRLALTFLWKRIKRIYPIYWFWTSILLLMWLMSLALKSHSYSSLFIITSYLLIPFKSESGNFHPLLDQGWTLSFEMYFYLIFSLVLIFVNRITNILWISFLFLLGALLGHLGWLGENGEYLTTNGLIIEFILGAIIAILVLKSKFLPKKQVFYRFLLILGCIALISSELYESVRIVEYGFPATLIVFSCVMIDRYSVEKDNKKLSLFSFLGDASYSIYLTHTFFVMVFCTLLKLGQFSTVNIDILIVMSSVITLTFSSLTYIYIEKKVIEFVGKLDKIICYYEFR